LNFENPSEARLIDCNIFPLQNVNRPYDGLSEAECNGAQFEYSDYRIL